MSTDNNYYNKTWNEPNNHGSLFWENVDFNKSEYKYQEMVFRNYLKTLDGIKTVLELGAGSGRVSNIILQELPSIEKYDIIDIRPQLPEEILNDKRVKVYSMDLTEHSGVNLIINGDKTYNEKYDLVLAIEVFMHIKPIDIDQVIFWLSHIGKQIINIDWTFDPDPNAEWYFIHDYEKLYKKYGAQKITRVDMKRIQQSLFHYNFDV